MTRIREKREIVKTARLSADFKDGHGTLTLTVNGVETKYSVERLSDGYLLSKQAEDAQPVYHVRETSCDCPAGSFGKPCKHRQAMEALRHAGKVT